MGFRSIRQRLHKINLLALGKFFFLLLILGMESLSHPTRPVPIQAPNQGTDSPSFANPLELEGTAHARVELWNAGFSGAVSVRDEMRWVF